MIGTRPTALILERFRTITETRAASSDAIIARPDEADPASTDREAPPALVNGPAEGTAAPGAPETAAATGEIAADPVEISMSDPSPPQQAGPALPQIPATAAIGTPDAQPTPPSPPSPPAGGGAAFSTPADDSSRGVDAAGGLRGLAGGFGFAPMGGIGSDNSGSGTPTGPIATDAPREPATAPAELSTAPIVFPPPEPLLRLSPLATEENVLGGAVATVHIQNAGKRSFTFEVDDKRFTVIDGEVRLQKHLALDYEAEPSVDLTLTATASDGTTLVTSFTVAVIDVNEAPTEVTLSTDTVAGYLPGAVVGTLTTADPDHGDSHTYSVDDARFEIVGSELRLKSRAALDPAAEPTVSPEVTTTDAGGSSHTENLTFAVAGTGQKTLVDTETASLQSTLAAVFGATPVAALDGGGFVVTWMSSGQHGSGSGIFGQRYDEHGEANGPEFQVNTQTTSHQSYSSVAALDDGGFVVTWQSWGQDGSGWGIYGQRFDADGNASGDEFLVNETTMGSQEYPGVVGLPGGDFAVVWTGNGSGDDFGVFLRLFGAGGVQVGTSGDDKLIGGTGDDLLIGMAGDDLLDGRRRQHPGRRTGGGRLPLQHDRRHRYGHGLLRRGR